MEQDVDYKQNSYQTRSIFTAEPFSPYIYVCVRFLWGYYICREIPQWISASISRLDIDCMHACSVQQHIDYTTIHRMHCCCPGESVPDKALEALNESYLSLLNCILPGKMIWAYAFRGSEWGRAPKRKHHYFSIGRIRGIGNYGRRSGWSPTLQCGSRPPACWFQRWFGRWLAEHWEECRQ